MKPSSEVAERVEVASPPDEREASDLFQRLTPQTQAKVRAAWDSEREAGVRWQEKRRESRARTLTETTLLLGLMMLLSRGLHGPSLAASTFAVAPCLGLIIDRFQPERATTALLGMLAHFAIAIGTGLSPADMFGALLTATTFGVYGVRREFRSSVGET